jgi:hypothetical protein
MARTQAQALAAELLEARCRLQAHEIALASIIGALDRSGALSIAEAKLVIDQAAANAPDTEQGNMARAALRELSARLVPAPPHDRRQ